MILRRHDNNDTTAVHVERVGLVSGVAGSTNLHTLTAQVTEISDAAHATSQHPMLTPQHHLPGDCKEGLVSDKRLQSGSVITYTHRGPRPELTKLHAQ